MARNNKHTIRIPRVLAALYTAQNKCDIVRAHSSGSNEAMDCVLITT